MQVKFDKTCPAWDNDPKFRLMFIGQQQNYFKELLKVRGYVTLMEVLNAFTIPFDIASYLDRPLGDLVWLRDRGDVVDIQIWDELEDATLILKINID